MTVLIRLLCGLTASLLYLVLHTHIAVTRTIHDWTPGREAIPTPSEGELPHDSPIMTLEDMAEVDQRHYQMSRHPVDRCRMFQDFAEAFKKLQLPVSHLVGNGELGRLK